MFLERKSSLCETTYQEIVKNIVYLTHSIYDFLCHNLAHFSLIQVLCSFLMHTGLTSSASLSDTIFDLVTYSLSPVFYTWVTLVVTRRWYLKNNPIGKVQITNDDEVNEKKYKKANVPFWSIWSMTKGKISYVDICIAKFELKSWLSFRWAFTSIIMPSYFA